ncbi:ABC-type Na+ efflux pump permease subunit [Paucibacter oligotrophus]|uniref:ABC-type Na+ efflux pump permease subunit n=1 Tax=Roseateles oligotrophus TaxID=1769250 RepID=A0A840L8N2_9BURK|nr:hypothetical protein [Roseateles oligotrophus]MBB4842568.1 ABC-type Na+ efflux pump permease subunit [Roseateles oligotrophus]
MNKLQRLGWHFRNELWRGLFMARRYWVEALVGMGILFGLFGGLLFAVLSVSGKSLASGEVDGLILGFALWMFANAAFASAATEVAEETEQRGLEQLCLAPLPLRALLGLRTARRVLGGVLLLLLTLWLIELLTAQRLQLHYLPTLGLALLAAPALTGVGYVLAGLLLMIKRGQMLVAAAYPLLIALVALPAYPVNSWALLPYALGAASAKALAAGAAVPASVWGLIALNSCFYLGLGLWLYRALEGRAKKLGVLGHL